MTSWLRWLASVLLGMLGRAMRWMGQHCLNMAARIAAGVVDEDAPEPLSPPRHGAPTRRPAGRPPAHWMRMVRDRAPHLVQVDGAVRMARFGRPAGAPPPAPPRGPRRRVGDLRAGRRPDPSGRPTQHDASEPATQSGQAGNQARVRSPLLVEHVGQASTGCPRPTPAAILAALRTWRRRIGLPRREAASFPAETEIGDPNAAAFTGRSAGEALDGGPRPSRDVDQASPNAAFAIESSPPKPASAAPLRRRPSSSRRPHRLAPVEPVARTRPAPDSQADPATGRRPAGPSAAFEFEAPATSRFPSASEDPIPAASSQRGVAGRDRESFSRPDRRPSVGAWIPYRRWTLPDRVASSPALDPWTAPPGPMATSEQSAVFSAAVPPGGSGTGEAIDELPGGNGMFAAPWPDLPADPAQPLEPIDLDRYTQQCRHRARIDAEQEGLGWNV